MKGIAAKPKRTLLVLSCFCMLFSMNMPVNTANAENKKNDRTYVQSKAECVMEVNSRRILYAHNSDTRLPMASTTKILTAITVLEHCPDIKEALTIPPEAAGIEGSSVYLKSGDIYTVEDLLYGLMLRSGNDCATALALHFGESIGGFSAKMNETAQKAGAVESNFENPHGLPCKDHYTTAKDLSLIACYAMQNKTFREIVGTKYYEPRNWKNKNKMLHTFEGGIGVKTGYTKEAGRCLVSAGQRGETTLVCTVLNSPSMYERSSQLLEDAFRAYSYEPIVKQGDVFELEKEKVPIKCYVKDSFSYPLLAEEKEFIKIEAYPLEKPSAWQIKEKIIGIFEIYLSNQLLFSGNLYKL